MGFIVDSGACDIVADPRSLPGYPINEIEEPRAGDAFVTVAGDPTPHLGQEDVVVCIESGDIRSIRAQCTIVSKPLLSMKRMTQAAQFVGFSEHGGFVLDPKSGNVDWFREENGNYVLDTWFVPHDKADDLVRATSNQGFARQSN